MNFKTISLLFILIFSIVGMANAATLNIQCKSYEIGIYPDEYVYYGGGNPLAQRTTNYTYTHTGQYKKLVIGAPIGKHEAYVFVFIEDLDNLNTYPSDQQLNVSFSPHWNQGNITTAPDFQHGTVSWVCFKEYGILDSDNILHYPTYYIPPQQ